MFDPYAILEVGRDASADQIKRSYRRLAKELHPDLHPNDPIGTRRFKDITAAYDILSDESKRKAHDREMAILEAQRQTGGGSFDDGLDAFFSARAWGGKPGTTAPPRPGAVRRRGADIYQSLTASFVEAAIGARKRLTLRDGRTVDVSIPPLTQDGQSLRLRSQGGAGQNGGESGDVFVEITVEPHPIFVRKDHDIHMALAVTVPEAVFGATITVPTIHGLVQLKIPPGSNTDTQLRLRGKGVALVGRPGHGDHYVTLKIVLPPNGDKEFARIVADWARTHPYTVRPAGV
jgi:DnaJ-class molecular chaperone